MEGVNEFLMTEFIDRWGAFGIVLILLLIALVIVWRQLLKKDKIIITLVGDFHKVATKSVDTIDESSKTLKEINNMLHSVNIDVQIIKSTGGTKRK